MFYVSSYVCLSLTTGFMFLHKWCIINYINDQNIIKTGMLSYNGICIDSYNSYL